MWPDLSCCARSLPVLGCGEIAQLGQAETRPAVPREGVRAARGLQRGSGSVLGTAGTQK